MKRGRKIAIGCGALLALPFVLVAAAVGPFYLRWIERRARRGRWGLRRDFSLHPPTEVHFSWMCKCETEARDALSCAVTTLVSLLPAVLRIESVESLEVENPRTGFSVSPSRLHLQPIVSDFGTEMAQMLHGEGAEFGHLIVNGQQRLSLDLDARSFVTGHFAVELPRPPSDSAMAAARTAFEIRKGDRTDREVPPDPSLQRTQPGCD